MREKNSAPARIRTWDQLIKSQLLYQLSYRGLRILRSRRCNVEGGLSNAVCMSRRV